jgi:hypothetical protein
MVDEVTAGRRSKIGKAVGRLDDPTMIRVNRAIALWFGLAS